MANEKAIRRLLAGAPALRDEELAAKLQAFSRDALGKMGEAVG